MTYHSVAHFQVEYTVIFPEYEHLVIGNFDILEQGNLPKYLGGSSIKRGIKCYCAQNGSKGGLNPPLAGRRGSGTCSDEVQPMIFLT